MGIALDADLSAPILAHNELRIAGWATADGEIRSIEVRIGTRRFRPPCQPLAGDGPGARFELIADTSDWERGEYPLEAVATDAGGASSSISGMVDVLPYRSPPLGVDAVPDAIANGTAAMWYESPELAGGKVTGDYPEVTGWATSRDGIDEVLVTIDDTLRLRAIHGLARPDLRVGFGDEVAADCGFALRLDPSELPPGQHVLTIVAVTRGGAAIGIAGTVDRLEHAAEDGPRPRDPDEHSAVGFGAGGTENDLGSGERYVPELHRGTSLEPEHHARYRWAAPLTARRKVLDAGCGVGWGTALLAEQGAEATGVDLSPLAIGEARRRHGAVAEFELGDLCQMPFDDDSFDAVVSFEAIEHVGDTDRAMREMHRVLRPGGLLLISSPNRGVYPEGNPFHLNELTSDELQHSLESLFSNVAIYRQQTYVATLIGADGVLELDDPSRLLDTTAIKMAGGPPGSELYTVAAATDGKLPAASSYLALGTEFDREEHLRIREPWEDRATRAEIELAKTRADARARGSN